MQEEGRFVAMAGDGNGATLELINPNIDNSIAASWSSSRLHGIPGYVNSSFAVMAEKPEWVIPANFSISQNYPNPFNPTTTIAFDIVRMAHVKLVVYNVLGQEVETLVDKALNPNKYEIEFNAGHLSSGIYFYRLETDNFVSTRKMLLLK